MNQNRWGIAAAGVVLQIVLGSVYAWSVFKTPLSKAFHWTNPQITLTFTITIFVVGFAAYFGGLWNTRSGPRIVAVTGAFLYGLGTILASLSAGRLWWLYASYGVISGIGLGFAYIIPIAVLVKWFPERRGFITGLAVGGFGLGALLTAPIANSLIHTVGVLPTFLRLGIGYALLGMGSAWFMRNPPEGWTLPGWTPSAATVAQRSARDYTLGEALKTWQWWTLWLILFLNTSAGISIISQEAPLFQELAKVSAAVAAGMVGLVAIGNAAGRVFWAWASDALTRRYTYVVMFLLQLVLFWFLPSVGAVGVLTVVAFVILMCYGGGFGVMPAFAADYFGSKNVGQIYGLMLTAWGAASAFGPLLLANMRQATGHYTSGLHLLSGIVLAAIVLPLIVRPPAAAR